MQNDTNKIQALEAQVKELMEWKKQRMAQQITYPLDVTSQTILQNYFMSISSIFDFILYGVAEHPARSFVGRQGNYSFEISPQSLFRYTVKTSNNEFTVQGTNMVNDQAVLFTTSDTPPDPLVGTDPYYVINSTGNTFQVSLTPGGAAVNITTTGVGNQYIYRQL